MTDLFKSGGYYPSEESEEIRIGAEKAHRMHYKDHDKPLINRCKFELFACLSCFDIDVDLIMYVVGLDDKERAAAKQSRTIRSRSPTLRKTETQDIYRTFLDVPDGQGGYLNEGIATP